MNDTQYLQYCEELLATFANDLNQRCAALAPDDSLRELAQAFVALADTSSDLYEVGPALISRLFTTYPDFAPLVPRELLWFFGGDCLHYMPDEEIEQFQRLENLRHEAAARGDTLDLRDARAKLLNLQ